LQSAQWIGNYDQRPRCIKRRARQPILRNKRSACAVAERVSQKAMAVSLLALQGNKKRAGSSAARICANTIDYGRGRSAAQFTTDLMRNTLQCRWDQVIAAPVRV